MCCFSPYRIIFSPFPINGGKLLKFTREFHYKEDSDCFYICDDLFYWKFVLSQLVEMCIKHWQLRVAGWWTPKKEVEALSLRFHTQLSSWLEKSNCPVTSLLSWYGPVHLRNWEHCALTRKFCGFKSLLISKYKGALAFGFHDIYS